MNYSCHCVHHRHEEFGLIKYKAVSYCEDKSGFINDQDTIHNPSQ